MGAPLPLSLKGVEQFQMKFGRVNRYTERRNFHITSSFYVLYLENAHNIINVDKSPMKEAPSLQFAFYLLCLSVRKTGLTS
jgi:hypothetical protein